MRNSTRRAQILTLGLGLALAVGGALAMWIAPRWSQTEFVRAFQKSEAGGAWPEALSVCLAREETVRAEAEFLDRCRHAAQRVAQGMGDAIEASEAVAAIRTLAAWGDRDALADALDRSRVIVPAGEFTMGSDDGRENEKPEHRVFVDSFAIGRFEVTNVQYARFVEAAGQHPPRYWPQGEFPRGQEDVPVVGVEWAEAQAYCVWTGGQLPTEAEWEKACRGEAANAYPWGNEWDPGRANINFGRERADGAYLSALYEILQATPDAGKPGLLPIGSFSQGASPSGLLDLAGNASEWVADWYNWDGYWDLPTVNPIGEGPEWNRSVRGSSWFFRRGMENDAALWSRCSARNSSHASIDPRVGFRCAYPVP